MIQFAAVSVALMSTGILADPSYVLWLQAAVPYRQMLSFTSTEFYSFSHEFPATNLIYIHLQVDITN
jgi:hypothetical protein